MKILLLWLLSVITYPAFAQPKIITQAIITTKSTMIVPEGEEDNMPISANTAEGGERRVMMRFGDAGETKAITYLKNELVKTVIKTDMANTVTIRDNAVKKTTTLIEAMGNKSGFYATDADQEEMKKRIDSMTLARSVANSLPGTNAAPVVEVVYAEGSKKIAGQECKKAYIIVTRNTTVTTEKSITVKAVTDSNILWYSPDIKLLGITNTGGSTSPFSFGRISALSGLERIDGFPMEYEMKMQRGRKMIVEVIKLELDKEVKDKEFEIPKDYDVKPMKEMQNAIGGGRFQMRVGG